MTAAVPASLGSVASLTLMGAGKMGGAMLEGWLAAGLSPQRATVLDPSPSEAIRALCAARGLALNPEAPAEPEILVLGIKPQGLEAAAPVATGLAGEETLVVSILAGKTVADLRSRMPRARGLVRAMPNLPASIGRGATGAYATPEVSDAQRRAAEALLAANGLVEWVAEEGLIDAVTALSGSGPAYVFLLAEAMARAGAAAGLPADLAMRLARATVSGAGELLARSEAGPDELRRNVTSPGGTTAAALEVLMADGALPDLVTRAVAAAKRRAGELAG